MNQSALTNRVMAVLIACVLAAVAGLFSAQSAYADVTAAETDAFDTATAQDDGDLEALVTASNIYRLYNPNTGDHFYTGYFNETMSLVKVGWKYEGVAYQSLSSGSTGATAVYRLYNPNSGGHHYTMSDAEKKTCIASGWRDEGTAFYAVTNKATADQLGCVAVYRQFNPNAKIGTHNYTMSEDERDSLVTKGWKDEGPAWYAYKYEEPSDFGALSAELYRLYNPNSGEHFYTANPGEVANLVRIGWNFESTAWTTVAKGENGAIPVYRVYNPNTSDHHFTTSLSEKDGCVKAGWKDEGVAFYVFGEENKDQGEAVYRAFNPNEKIGTHNFTTSKDEQSRLAELGWKDEGVAWYGLKTTAEVTA